MNDICLNIKNFKREINDNKVVETYEVDNPHISKVTNRYRINTNEKETDMTDVIKIMIVDYLRDVKKIEI